jgi:hypothetical protein
MVNKDKIRKALRSGGDIITPSDLLLAAEAGQIRAWTAGDSILVGGIHNDALVFHLGAGTYKEIFGLLEEAYAWGREQGAERAVFLGRKGWSKFKDDLGWTVTGTLLVYEREI